MQSLGLQTASVLQHPQGGSNKMVSLDLLLGSPPATPRESPMQVVSAAAAACHSRRLPKDCVTAAAVL